jgi:hypothetical protein
MKDSRQVNEPQDNVLSMGTRWPVKGMVLALLSGCGQRDCTNVGPPSTITVDTARVVGAHEGRLVARLCLNDSCNTFNQHSSRLGVIDIEDPSIEDAGPVEVVLTITDEENRIIFDGASEVTLTLMQPNGSGCPPEKFAASLSARGQSSLGPRRPA